ncbi:MAG TPA: transglycosylase SLT domain-containing protein [Candidatus Paceibacterota bacterium]|nr:transglycosylase SLT domain-containing protein [Candidatus Paceibacterota bacterium]
MRTILVACALAQFSSPAWAGTGSRFAGYEVTAPRAVREFGYLVHEMSARYGIPVRILIGIMLVESTANPDVPGGLMQTTFVVKRATGIWCDTREPRCSLHLAAAYLHRLRYYYGFERWERVILAYNAGPTAAALARVPDIHPYVQRVELAMIAYQNAIDGGYF